MQRLAGCTALLAITLFLSGCDVAYDRTKGWATRLSDWADEELQTLEQNPPDWQEPERPLVADPAADDQLAYAAAIKPKSRAERNARSDRSDVATGGTGNPPKPANSSAEGQSRNGSTIPPLPRSKPKPPAAAARLTPQQAGYIVHLASMRSQSSAHREWQQLQRTYPRYLRKLKVSIEKVDLGKRGVFYRVLAGPFRDKRTARKVCSGLQEQRQYCSIVGPGTTS